MIDPEEIRTIFVNLLDEYEQYKNAELRYDMTGRPGLKGVVTKRRNIFFEVCKKHNLHQYAMLHHLDELRKDLIRDYLNFGHNPNETP